VALKKVLWSESIRSRVEAGQAHFLSRASLRALTAGSAPVFLDIATSDRPDLIVLEAGPADPPADDLCRRLRADERTRRIPILALAPPGEPAERLRQAGCGRVLDQATPPGVLQDLIAAALGIRLRRHPRFAVVLPVARGRIFHEFLGYTNEVSEGGLGF
jgi:DNA-binding response OmpR family regulator